MQFSWLGNTTITVNSMLSQELLGLLSRLIAALHILVSMGPSVITMSKDPLPNHTHQ